MAAIKSPGLILRKTPYSETSLILKVYTRESGLITLMAKGAKRPKSRFAGVLDFFTLDQFIYPEKSRTEIHTLTDASLIQDFPRVKTDPAVQALAHVFLELYLRYLPEPQPSPAHYAWLVGQLESLDGAEGIRDHVLRLCDFILGLCSVSGFSPQFSVCVQCGRDMASASGSARGAALRVHMDPDLGGPVCAACSVTGAGGGPVFSGRALRWLDRVQSLGELAGHIPRSEELQAEAFLLAFLGKHAGGARPVKSLEFYHQMLGTHGL